MEGIEGTPLKVGKRIKEEFERIGQVTLGARNTFEKEDGTVPEQATNFSRQTPDLDAFV